MDQALLRERFASSPVARLATVRPGGQPHVVPVVFAVAGQRLYSAVDAKPKRSRNLQRLVNLRHEPRAHSSSTTMRTTGRPCGGCVSTGGLRSWRSPRPTTSG